MRVYIPEDHKEEMRRIFNAHPRFKLDFKYGLFSLFEQDIDSIVDEELEIKIEVTDGDILNQRTFTTAFLQDEFELTCVEKSTGHIAVFANNTPHIELLLKGVQQSNSVVSPQVIVLGINLDDVSFSRQKFESFSVWNDGADRLAFPDSVVHITKLNVFSNSITTVDGLAAFKGLIKLDLSSCYALRNVDGLEGLTSLAELNLRWCRSLLDIDGLVNLSQLTELDFTGCKLLSDVKGLSKLMNLTALDLNGCMFLSDINPVANLTQLTNLDLSGCKYLTNVDGLSNLTQLTNLNLSGCLALKSLDDIANLRQLAVLNLGECQSLTKIEVLQNLHGLVELGLSSCKSIVNADILSNMTQLTRLDLSFCISLTDINGLASLVHLSELDVDGCSAIRDVEPLRVLPNLKELEYDIDPPLAASILISSALKREDNYFIDENLDGWLALLPRSKDPNDFVSRIAEAISFIADEYETGDYLTELIGKALAFDELSAATWSLVFEACLKVDETTLEKVVEGMQATELPLDLLEPWLTAISKVSDDNRQWAIDLVDATLQPLEEHALGRELAPAICLFYRRMNQPREVEAWMERATVASAPIWLDRIHLAAIRAWLRDELQDAEEARLHLDKIVTPSVKDAGRAEIARFMAEKTPAEAGEMLDKISDDLTKAALASELSNVAPFTESLENCYKLLLAMEADPDALADLIENIQKDHPDNLLVDELTYYFGPDRQEDDDDWPGGTPINPGGGMPSSLDEVLEQVEGGGLPTGPISIDVGISLTALSTWLFDGLEEQMLVPAGLPKYKQFKQEFLDDSGKIKTAFFHGVFSALVEAGLADEANREDYREALSETLKKFDRK